MSAWTQKFLQINKINILHKESDKFVAEYFDYMWFVDIQLKITGWHFMLEYKNGIYANLTM